MIKSYKRKYKGLIRKARIRDNAIKYPAFKVGDKVTLVDNIMDIHARILGTSGGYIGPQARARLRMEYLHLHSIQGKIVEIRVADIYVKFKVKNKFYRKKHDLDKPLLVYKQMITHS